MEQYVELENKKGILRGMIHIPDADAKNNKYPGVVLYHGFTGNRMEPGFMFVRFSRLLMQHGIASVRFDFWGSGESSGDFDKMTLSGELEDAGDILNYFSSREEIDKDKVFILGLSMGGTVAGYTAGLHNNDVKGLILWAPAGDMKNRLAEREEMLAKEAFKGNPMDMEGLVVGMQFIEDIKSLNVFDTTAKYRGDVLIIHGTEDKSVPPKVSKHYSEIFGNRASLEFIEGANHTYQGSEWISRLFTTSLGFIKARI